MIEIRRISREVIRTLAILLLTTALVGDAHAQVGGTRTGSTSTSPLELLRQRMAQSVSSSTGVPQEGAVDPSSYRVGPGDVFEISVGGLQAGILPATVSADGYLSLPDAGAVKVSGLSLNEAREKIHQQMKSAYRNVPVTSTLSQPRQFYVHVVGAVTSPGRHLVMPVGRVMDAVTLAFADTTRPPTSNLRFQPSFRNVSITGIAGDVRSADLIRYLITGDTRHNPYLQDGDVIQVSAYDPTSGSVFINGDVPFAGTYEHRGGDTVADLLALATGRGEVADRHRLVRITRRNADGTVSSVPGSANVDASDFSTIVTRPLDQVYFAREPGDRKGVVIAEGALAFPGSYPIESGSSLLDLIDAAGGFKQEALLRGAFLERRAALSMNEFPVRFVGLRLGPNVPPMYLPDTSAVLQRIRLAPLDWRGTNYLMREMQAERRVAVDLAEASREELARIQLLDGDRLVVPRDDGTILVFGQVTRAGLISFEPGKSVSHYLRAAGGRADLAADVYLIEAGTGAYQRGDGATVRAGDMIFVDSREYLADSVELSRLAVEQKRIEADSRTRTTQIIIQSVGAIASIIALIISASR